ncbi:response regulator [Zobellella sp. DQSA1]|uniref:response regulator n=1 Tax=Zobellella sp. DQSA1 TaxID=3342386 RepID=UPI0035C1230F
MTQVQPATLLLVDDHPLMRKGIKTWITAAGPFNVVAEADNGAEAQRLAAQINPDLILLDLNLGEEQGSDVLLALRQQGYQGKVVILTVSDSQDDAQRLLDLGADGYLLKDIEPESLIPALKQALLGDKPVSEKLQEAPRHASAEHLASLTYRERQILALLAEGFSNKQIADNLNIAEGTVKVHMKALMRKLDVQSRLEAALIYLNGREPQSGKLQKN